ncbi:alpha/beta fold hydrolase [Streptomyces misionensis]|uniref:alpha/beta fold hydrolase n=1 Tax=Streptomyces misionensis TaxID=67331 RepID=UPI0036AA8C32
MSTADWLPDGFVQQIDTNRTRLSVAVGGSGPVLILLHGWPQTSRAWARVMSDLAPEPHRRRTRSARHRRQ